MRVSPSRLWARVADRLGTDPESAQLEVLGAAGYSWCVPATDPSFPFHRGVPDFFRFSTLERATHHEPALTVSHLSALTTAGTTRRAS